MNGTLYAVDMRGRPVARLMLAEGADKLDAELFVSRGKVAGASSVIEGPATPVLVESENRITAAVADALAMPEPQPLEAPHAAAYGSAEESERRIDDALARLDGKPASRPFAAVESRLPVVTVPRQEPNPAFALDEGARKAKLAEVKATLDRIEAKVRAKPNPAPILVAKAPVVSPTANPSLTESEQRITHAINGL